MPYVAAIRAAVMGSISPLLYSPGNPSTGVLPLVDVRSVWFGRFLVSMPFLNAGGPLGSPEAVRSLSAAAVELADKRRADLLELRCGEPLDTGLIASTEKITCMLPLPEDPHIKFAGLLSDIERAQALEAAAVVAVPSPYESLSLLALEAMAVGTPILANARSEVLVDHCLKSNAGLFYADRWEFVECLSTLMGDQRLRAAMGRNGREYVRHNYRWDVILAKYERMIARVKGR